MQWVGPIMVIMIFRSFVVRYHITSNQPVKRSTYDRAKRDTDSPHGAGGGTGVTHKRSTHRVHQCPVIRCTVAGWQFQCRYMNPHSHWFGKEWAPPIHRKYVVLAPYTHMPLYERPPEPNPILCHPNSPRPSVMKQLHTTPFPRNLPTPRAIGHHICSNTGHSHAVLPITPPSSLWGYDSAVVHPRR